MSKYLVLFKIIYLTLFFGSPCQGGILEREDKGSVNRDDPKLGTIVESATTNSLRESDESLYEPEAFMNSGELITSKGYPYESYNITTADGYILSMHRIPHGVKGNTTKASVFLQHGLLCSSVDWLINHANQSLAYLLADNNFDVWMGDTRGNTYSRRHVTLNPDENEFWNFTWDQMAQYDVPAFLEHILKVTESEHLYYVGHSQGSLMAFASFSQNQALAKRVKVHFALAPVVFLNNTKMEKIALVAPLLDMSRIPLYMAHYPAGTSVKNLHHMSQAIKSGKFLKFDYKSTNKKIYGQPTPPEYDLKNYHVPTMLFSGSRDLITTHKDIKYLEGNLSNLLKHVSVKEANHNEFIYGLNAASDYYSKIIQTMDLLENNEEV